MIHDLIDTVGQFRDRFHAMGRTNQFTYQAFDVLFEEMNERNEYTLVELERDYDEAKEAMDIIRFDPETDDDDPSEIELAIHEAMDDSHTVMACGNGNWLVSS